MKKLISIVMIFTLLTSLVCFDASAVSVFSKKIKCQYCKDTKKCNTCKGKGYYIYNKQKWPCLLCGATGICYNCATPNIKQAIYYRMAILMSSGNSTPTASTSGGYSSGSASSGYTICGVCHGTKKCVTCGGSGIYSRYGNSSKCTACGGTGICWECHGTGR